MMKWHIIHEVKREESIWDIFANFEIIIICNVSENFNGIVEVESIQGREKMQDLIAR